MRVNKPSSLVLMVVAAAAMAPAAAHAQPKPAANPTAQATLLGQYGDWGAYTASPGGRKVVRERLAGHESTGEKTQTTRIGHCRDQFRCGWPTGHWRCDNRKPKIVHSDAAHDVILVFMEMAVTLALTTWSTRVGFICTTMIVVARRTTPLIGWPHRYDASDSWAE